jgi:hypothetical protein
LLGQGLLAAGCAILKPADYDAQAATLMEAEILSRSGEEFDLIIVSRALKTNTPQ